jgi:hypothetical protein
MPILADENGNPLILAGLGDLFNACGVGEGETEPASLHIAVAECLHRVGEPVSEEDGQANLLKAERDRLAPDAAIIRFLFVHPDGVRVLVEALQQLEALMRESPIERWEKLQKDVGEMLKDG